MKTIITSIALIFALAMSGCSVYKAATQAPAVDLAGVGVGTPRGELIGRLGAPATSSTNLDGTKEDIFNFASGMHGLAKARIILYLAADLFTLTLAEVVLWPIELTVADAAQCVAFATYDQKQTIEVFKVTQKSGVQGCS